VSFWRQGFPLWSISFKLCGGFGQRQASGISIMPLSARIPQEIERFLEYVTNFIFSAYLFSEFIWVNGIKNNLNLQWKSFLMLFKVKDILLFWTMKDDTKGFF
jgi:hypothetical protein